jgi:cell division protein ZapA
MRDAVTKGRKETNRQLEVKIYGQRYVIKGEAEEGYISVLAGYVDEKMKMVAANTKIPTTSKLAILAAINIAHELFQLKAEQHMREITLSKRTRSIIDSLEEQFEDLKLE